MSLAKKQRAGGKEDPGARNEKFWKIYKCKKKMKFFFVLIDKTKIICYNLK